MNVKKNEIENKETNNENQKEKVGIVVDEGS